MTDESNLKTTDADRVHWAARAEKAEAALAGFLGPTGESPTEAKLRQAEAEVEGHRRTALTCLRARRSERTLKRKAEAALAKCEQQKRGLATAAKTGMVAANRVIELEAEVEKLKCCGNCEMCAEVGVWCHEAVELGYEGARDAGWPNWYQDGSFNVHVHIGDHCHFTPSRWQRRES